MAFRRNESARHVTGAARVEAVSKIVFPDLPD
jgi:hypothetical protein